MPYVDVLLPDETICQDCGSPVRFKWDKKLLAGMGMCHKCGMLVFSAVGQMHDVKKLNAAFEKCFSGNFDVSYHPVIQKA